MKIEKIEERRLTEVPREETEIRVTEDVETGTAAEGAGEITTKMMMREEAGDRMEEHSQMKASLQCMSKRAEQLWKSVTC